MSERLELTGVRSGRLTAICYAYSNDRGQAVWKCKCDCGNYKNVMATQIKAGIVKSCGCLKKERTLALNATKKKYNQYEFDDKFAYGALSNSDKPFIVDLDDYDKIKDIYWYVDSDGYVKGHNPKTNKQIKLHKLIMGDCGNFYIDHSDRNKLNNSKSNLRKCSQKENSINRTISKNSKSGYLGVYQQNGKWRAAITINQKMMYLGSYATKEEALIERLKAEKKYFKEFAPQRHLFEKYNI